MTDNAITYQLVRSRRKTLALEISRDLQIVVRAPLRCPKRDIDAFVLSHRQWIDTHMAKMQARKESHPEPTPEEIAHLKAQAKAILPGRVAYYAQLMNLMPTSLKITSARTRFGSCSGKNGLCFSYLLMRYPPEAIDYVIVHELAHIVHKNHGTDFHALVASYLPDHKARRAMLRGS